MKHFLLSELKNMYNSNLKGEASVLVWQLSPPESIGVAPFGSAVCHDTESKFKYTNKI